MTTEEMAERITELTEVARELRARLDAQDEAWRVWNEVSGRARGEAAPQPRDRKRPRTRTRRRPGTAHLTVVQP